MADNNSLNRTHDNKLKDARWGYRHQQCVLLFLMFTITHSIKSSIGVGLVAMTKYNQHDMNMTDSAGQINKTSFEFQPVEILNTLLLVPPYPIFNWTKKIQDTVIASYYWGYVIMQLPAGQLLHKLGVRCLLSGAMTINCIILVILPIASCYGSWYLTVVFRVAQGIGQACIIPAIHSFLGKWTPIQERGKLAGFVFGGQAVGTLVGLPITGFIAASSMGWPGIFRFYGIISGITALILWFLIFNTPAEHPKISFLEQKYIEDDLGVRKKKTRVPWLKILSDKGVYALICGHIAGSWGHLTFYSEVPVYLDKIMKVDIKANGLLTALPFLGMFVSNTFYSWFTDWLIINNIMSVTSTRKLANSLGYIPAGMLFIALAYTPQDIYAVETLLVLICVFKICAHCGYLINFIDLSPNYAGTLMSISSFLSDIGTSAAPIIFGFILTDVENVYLWRQVFFLTAGVYFVANLIYVLLATSERAEWDGQREEKVDTEESLSMMNKDVQYQSKNENQRSF